MKKGLKLFLIFTLVFVLSFNGVNAQEQQDDPQEVIVLVETAPIVKIKGNNNSLILSWESVTNANSYVIERSTDSKKGFKKIATITSTTYTDKKLTYGTKYYYKVTARGTSNSKKSDVVGKKVVPNKVTNVTLKPGSYNIKVYWNQTKNSGYYVYQSTDGKKWTKVKTITDKTVGYFNNKKLKSNKIYYYQVQAYQKVGSKIVTGSKSDIVSIRTAPAAPTAKFVNNGLESIYINLKPTKGAKYYKLYQYSNETKKYELEYKIEPDWFYNGECDLYFYVEKPYTTLKFKVRACSDTVCGSFKELSGQAQLRKTDIYSLRGEKTSATLMFDSVSGAQGYEIYRATSKNGKYTKIKTLKGQDNTVFKNTKLASGKTYYYKVRSYVKINGKTRYSSYSSKRSVKTGSGAGINSAMEDAKKLNKDWYYSKKGLISILTEYLGYSASDAKKGVEKCKIDYKANALKLAKEFLDYYYGVSENGLRKVLSESYFTQAEIDYAISKVNVNWHDLLVSQIKEDLQYGYSEQQYLNNYAEEEYGYTQAEVLAVLDELNVDYNIQALNRLNTYLDRNNHIGASEARAYLEECEFTTDQINYAFENVEYDWLAALEDIAQEYFDYNEHSYGYSKQMLIEYIASYIETNNYETYSSDEIGQVIDRFEFDFKERAYDLADYMADNWYSSRAYIIDYLTNEYKFTEEEVNYAITEVDKEYNFNEVAVNWVGDLALNVHANDLGLNETSIREALANALFTQDNIDYAIANCGINYNDEALITAKYYIEKANVSKQSLIDALMELGFTESQATYASENEEFDYNQECADLLSELTHSLTPTQLRDFLKSEYKFTDENIDYAFEVHNIVEE